jgi:hypothetical protein
MAWRLITCLLFRFFVTGTLAGNASEPGDGDVLTTIGQVRALTCTEAARGYAVDLQAIVTFQTHDRNLFVHDYKKASTSPSQAKLHCGRESSSVFEAEPLPEIMPRSFGLKP